MSAHGLFDWLLMFSERVGDFLGVFLYLNFIVGDVFLWRLGLKLIKKHQQNSLKQAQEAAEAYDNGYRQI